jgi:hypothetical protein
MELYNLYKLYISMQEDKIVLICATGRSGSTTLQRIINTIPDSNICGENRGAVNCLLEFYMNLLISSSTNIHGRFRPTSYESLIQQNIKPSWYNSYNIGEVELQLREMILNLFKKDTTTNLWGFKEIRYHGKLHLLKYFKRLFPQTKVIIQIRENISAQSKSGWFKKDKNSSQELHKMNTELIKFYNSNRGWCYFTTFEKLFDKNNLQNIFRFIGCIEKYDEEKVKKVLLNNLKD